MFCYHVQKRLSMLKKQYLNIINALLISILFSSSLYLEYFSYKFVYLNTFISLFVIYLIINSSKNVLFFTGFFIGILWFYWISFSFIYYDLKYLIPLVIILIALLFAFIFYFIGLVNNIYFKSLMFFLLSYLQPFNFNWLQPEIILVNSIFSIEKEAFALVIFSMLIFSVFKKYYKLLFIIPLFFALENKSSNNIENNLNIFLPEVNIDQNKKWNRVYLNEIIDLNNKLISKAIEHNYDLVVLPETAYPLVLNKNQKIFNFLLEKSKHIDIIVGSLNQVNNSYYNSSYHFSKQKVQIANKVVLVPFGESIPFPKFMRDIINNIFYNGAEDFSTAKEASTFKIKNINFRSAICYEATTDKIFENMKDTKYMISISNNAWFMPSIQTILQKQLLRYYSKKYNVIIYHSINASENYILKPEYFSIKKDLKKLIF